MNLQVRSNAHSPGDLHKGTTLGAREGKKRTVWTPRWSLSEDHTTSYLMLRHGLDPSYVTGWKSASPPKELLVVYKVTHLKLLPPPLLRKSYKNWKGRGLGSYLGPKCTLRLWGIEESNASNPNQVKHAAEHAADNVYHTRFRGSPTRFPAHFKWEKPTYKKVPLRSNSNI